jgi:hypothetical protein
MPHEQRGRGKKKQRGGDDEHGIGEQARRGQRLRRAELHAHVGRQRGQAGRAQASAAPRQPGPGRAAQHRQRQQRCAEDGAQHGAGDVDAPLHLPLCGQVQPRSDGGQRDDADRHVDQENPLPAQVVEYQPAEHGPQQDGADRHDAEDGLEARPFAARRQVGDDGHHQRTEAAAADSLDGAQRDQPPHRRRQRAQRRAGGEQGDGDLEYGFAAVQVAQLAEHQCRDGAGEQVGGGDPRRGGGVAERLAQAVDGGGDDGLVQRRDKQHQHQRRHDGADGASGWNGRSHRKSKISNQV